MELLISIGLIMGFIFVSAIVTEAVAHRRQVKRDALFGVLGFHQVSPTVYRHRVGGVPVMLTDVGNGELEVALGVKLPLGFAATRRTSRSPTGDPIGDPTFDEAVTIAGERSAALALLTPELRRTILEATRAGWSIGPAGLLQRANLVDPDELIALVTSGKATMAPLLELKVPSTPLGLLTRVTSDPVPGVRLAAIMEILARDHHWPGTLTRALELAAADPDPGIRFFVARRTSSPRLYASVALASKASDKLRTDSVEALLRAFPDDPNTLDLFDRLGRHLQGQILLPLSPEDLAVIVRATAGGLDRDAVRRLHELACASDSSALQLASIDTLLSAGGLWAVPMLTPLRDRFAIGSATRAAARRAIDAIQSRSGLGAGALALSAEGGGLAVVTAQSSPSLSRATSAAHQLPDRPASSSPSSVAEKLSSSAQGASALSSPAGPSASARTAPSASVVPATVPSSSTTS